MPESVLCVGSAVGIGAKPIAQCQQSTAKKSITPIENAIAASVDAVEVIVRKNPGQILNTDFVTGKLYPELLGVSLSQAKQKVELCSRSREEPKTLAASSFFSQVATG